MKKRETELNILRVLAMLCVIWAHALILSMFASIGLEPTVLHPVVAMPLITLLTFVITVVIVMIIRKILKLGKAIT